MRLMLLSVFTLVLIFSGCSKDLPTQPESSKIYGSWVLVKTSGGFAGTTEYADPNNIATIRISKDGIFSEYRQNKLIKSLEFEIKEDTTFFSTKPRFILSFKNQPSHFASLVILELSQKQLVLSDNFIDGYEYFYEWFGL